MSPGTQFANIRNMADVQGGPTLPSALNKRSENRGRSRSQSRSQGKAGTAAVIFAVVLGVAGLFAWRGMQHSNSASASAAAESTLALETFVVNLKANANGNSGSSPRAFLRIGITLGLAHPVPRNQPEAVPTALVRDIILSVLATAQPDELLKAEGKRQLKDELLKALQERVPQLAVENVYFTELLVQM
ncbi:MAG: flagellar basal body-associated FliL family protein [Terriglobales bacterium]